jgi:hypothetical protein
MKAKQSKAEPTKGQTSTGICGLGQHLQGRSARIRVGTTGSGSASVAEERTQGF